MAEANKFHKAWQQFFDDHDIIDQVQTFGFVDVSADQLRAYERPRLLCKVDYRDKVPPVFAKAGLSLLAIRNGTYRIAPTDPFFEIDIRRCNRVAVERRSVPSHILTIDPEHISSESIALDAAAAAGILDDLLGDELTLTMRGRRRSRPFEFELAKDGNGIPIRYKVSSVQIEIDGGYEGHSNLMLVEAKNSVSKTMNIRQTLYPQLHFENEMGSTKRVSTYVLFYDREARVMNFIPLAFQGAVVQPDYSGVRRFRLAARKATPGTSSGSDFLEDGKQLTCGSVFPQANDFSKVLNVLETIADADGPISREEAMFNIDDKVVGRQLSYYTDALAWFGAVEVTDGLVHITTRGHWLASLPEDEKLQAMERIMLSDPLAHAMLVMRAEDLPHELTRRYNISKSTPARRQSTIKRWSRFFDEFRQSLAA